MHALPSSAYLENVFMMRAEVTVMCDEIFFLFLCYVMERMTEEVERQKNEEENY